VVDDAARGDDPRRGGLETCYTGPWLWFDPAAYQAPAIPAGGLPAAEPIAAYLAGSPVPLGALRPGRLALRGLAVPPSPLWRRMPAPPHLSYPRHPEHLEAWQRFDARLRAAAVPARLAEWYRQIRGEWWARYAIHRFAADAADAAVGAIGAFMPNGDPVPASYFESDTGLDPDSGNLFCRNDGRVPLCPRLRFHAAGDAPERETGPLYEFIRSHCDQLLPLPPDGRVTFLRQRMPHLTQQRAYQAIHRIVPTSSGRLLLGGGR
jgi:hypothetical protein